MAPVRLVGALLALVTLLLFAQVAGFDFVNYDDPEYVAENPRVLQGITPAGTAWAFRTFHFSNWHPLTWLSHMLDVEVFGPQPGAHHLVNLLLHTANVLLLYALLLRWTGAVWASALVAALFAWHPLRVESVAWVAERKDVLCALFGLFALHAYTAHARAPRASRMWLVAAWLALGLMAKPMLVTLPLVLLLLDVWPLRRRDWPPADPRSWRAGLLEKWPLFVLIAASCVLTVAAQRAAAMRTLEEVPWDLRLANAAVAGASYVLRTLWPADLSVFYPLPRSLPGWRVAGSVALLAGLSWLAWRERARRPWLAVGWLWFLGMLVPVSGLVAIGGHARADRYMYLPQLGLFLMAVWSVREQVLLGRWAARPVAWAGALVLLACAAGTWVQLGHWRDAGTLFRHALRVNPDNATACINLGAWEERQGRPAEALTHYLAALRLQPGRAQVHNNLGNVLDALGRPEEAIGHYQEALRLKPGTALVHRNLGAALAGRGRYPEAMTHYTEAQRLAPEDPQVRYLIGLAWLRQGQARAGLGFLREALRLHPVHARALDQLARVLATDEDPALRDGAEAVRLASRAVEATSGRQPQALDTLGMALAEAGRFEEATAAARQAAELLDAIGEPGPAAAVRQRMGLYQARQAYREREHGR